MWMGSDHTKQLLNLLCIVYLANDFQLQIDSQHYVMYVYAGKLCAGLFDLILKVPVNNFQLCLDGSSWVEPVLS